MLQLSFYVKIIKKGLQKQIISLKVSPIFEFLIKWFLLKKNIRFSMVTFPHKTLSTDYSDFFRFVSTVSADISLF